MNILILVLSARTQPWGSLMDCSMETWDSDFHRQTITRYYCGKSDHEINMFCWNSSKFTEALEHVSPRTLEAFERSLEIEWEYCARPNSSCYVHKKNLVSFCETLPKENVICGVLSEGKYPFLWGGCQYIFSRDVIEKFVTNKDKWNPHAMDDQSITFMAEALGIPLESKGRCASINMMPNGSWLCFVYNHGENFVFSDWNDINKAQPHHFIRVKHDPDRSVDLKVMRLLHQYYK